MPKPRNAEKPPRVAIAIMAAGKGTRLKSRLAKVLHKVGGQTMLEHVIAAAARVAAPRDIFAIIGHDAERVQTATQHTGINFILQEEQRGTGHALMVAASTLRGYDHVIVLSGDVPLIREQTIRRLWDFHAKQRAAMTILTAEPADPGSYGRVLRKRAGAPEVSGIVEAKALKPAQKKAREINAGIYAFAVKPLLENLHHLGTDNAHREFYLTDMAALLVKAHKRVVAIPADNATEVFGANTLAELAALDARLRAEKAAALMASGVTIYRPETSLIDATVDIAPDAVLEPFVQLLGKTTIGSGTLVRSFSIIKDSHIAEDVTVRPGCVIDGAKVARGAILGPYAHLRPGSDIGEEAHVGNFVETKKARLGKGTKANHLTYLGDAEIGAGVNVGAGTITCNYDGANKHQTTIEDGAFIGSDTTLVAPVRVGRGAYVGAASCITDDVPAESLALGRARQTVKEGWARERAKKRQQRAGKD